MGKSTRLAKQKSGDKGSDHLRDKENREDQAVAPPSSAEGGVSGPGGVGNPVEPQPKAPTKQFRSEAKDVSYVASKGGRSKKKGRAQQVGVRQDRRGAFAAL